MTLRGAAAVLALSLAWGGCAADRGESSGPDASGDAATPGTSPPSPTPSPTSEPTRAGPEPSDGTPLRAALSIPRLGIGDLEVAAYRGRPDDAPGTRIQDGGIAASPHGSKGGIGPGGLGNYIVTAHRTSSTRAFLDLPLLERGDRVTVRAGGVRYVYKIVRTRSTSFRSADSLRRQAAAVPGRPGAEPTRAMITLSTCATPEDHAAGNYWSDEFGNPEHRIDKIGVLVRSARAQAR